jgi:hypothetical protein
LLVVLLRVDGRDTTTETSSEDLGDLTPYLMIRLIAIGIDDDDHANLTLLSNGWLGCSGTETGAVTTGHQDSFMRTRYG